MDPHPGRCPEAAASSCGELELQRRGSRGPPHPLAARQDSGRIKFNQRDAVCARQSSRFRRLGADGLPWLEFRRRSAVLPQIRGLQARRRPGIPRQGRPAQSRRLPHHSTADAQIHRGRAAGRVQVQQGPERPPARRRRLLTDDPQGTLARLNRSDIPPRGSGTPKPARGNRGFGHETAVRRQTLHRRRIPPAGPDARGACAQGGHPVRRSGQLAAFTANLRGGTGGASAIDRRDGGA